MDRLASNKAKNKKRKKLNKKLLKKYWSLLEPAYYADLMVAQDMDNASPVKTASRLKKVILKGRLSKTDDGFIYVKLSNDVIHGLFTMLDDEGIEKPPYFSKSKMGKGIGAHISAISNEELEEKEIKEIGKEISFELGEVKSTNPAGWYNMERVWFVTVKSPELEKLRKRYDLPKTYKNLGHDFHITFAVKKK